MTAPASFSEANEAGAVLEGVSAPPWLKPTITNCSRSSGRRTRDAQVRLSPARHGMPSGPQWRLHRCGSEVQGDQSEAYECLKDPQKRAAYDRFGHAAFRNGGGGNGGGGAAGFRLLRRHFRQYFRRVHGRAQQGRGRGGANVLRGSDLRYDLEITLEDAFHGRPVELTVDTTALCEPCDGTGAKPGTGASACTMCGGARPGARAQRLLRGRADLPDLPRRRRDDRRSLPVLPGRGPGREAQAAEGRYSRRRRRGHPHPSRRRRRGRGARRPAGRSLHLRPPRPARPLQREGTTLFARCPVSFTTAALGGSHRGARARQGHGMRSRFPPAPSPASSSASAAPACRA